jgi:hypothetical protein
MLDLFISTTPPTQNTKDLSNPMTPSTPSTPSTEATDDSSTPTSPSTESVRSILLRQGSDWSTTSTDSSKSRVRFHLDPHPREAWMAEREAERKSQSKTKGNGHLHEAVPRQGAGRRFLGLIGISGLYARRKASNDIPVLDEREILAKRQRAHERRERRRRARSAKDVKRERFTPNDPVPLDVRPYEYRRDQIIHKTEMLLWEGAWVRSRTPAPRKLSFNEMVQRDVIDKGHLPRMKPRVCGQDHWAERCSLDYDCDRCFPLPYLVEGEALPYFDALNYHQAIHYFDALECIEDILPQIVDEDDLPFFDALAFPPGEGTLACIVGEDGRSS